MARIGILGGTFDPPHAGHLILARTAIKELSLDRLILIPAASPPHKADRRITPAQGRLAMTRALIEGEAKMEVSTIEIDREGASYTVDTLRELARRHPGDELFLMIGTDQAQVLDTWREIEEIARLAEIVVVRRPAAGDEAAATPVPVRTVSWGVPSVSSTTIRASIASGQSPDQSLYPRVAQIVCNLKLYTP